MACSCLVAVDHAARDVHPVRLRHLCRTAGASSAKVGEARGGRVAAPLAPRVS